MVKNMGYPLSFETQFQMQFPHLKFGHMVGWLGGWLQFPNVHRSGTRFPRKSSCIFCRGKRPFCFVVCERMPTLFLRYQETPQKRPPGISYLLSHARRTSALCLLLLRHSQLKCALFLMRAVSSERGTPLTSGGEIAA